VKRALAKAAYGVGGWLSKVKTPTMSRRLVTADPFVTDPDRRVWLPCGPSIWLTRKSMQLDWGHWDHWALIHDKCAPVPCAVCGGCSCDDESDTEEAAC
jgi:hypothetical protein